MTNISQLIIEKAEIEKIISKYLNISKKGNNFVALCPFHEDSRPSLVISPIKKIYKCFACNSGGNIITFIINYLNVSFKESLLILSKELNFDQKQIEELESRISDRYTNDEKVLIKYNDNAANLYKYNLIDQAIKYKKLNQYLKKRNISKKIVDDFNIGWTLDNKMLTNYFQKKQINLDDIYNTGLLNKNDKEFYDFFNNRLIFPITNEYGDIVGFSGRVISDGKFSKYINTRDTAIFKKQNILYNLYNCKKQKKINNIIIVEGFMDVIAFYHAGINNCVATMGLNISNAHINKLKTITNTITLCLDFDKSGLLYSLKIAKKLLENNFLLNIIPIENYKDIDSYLSNNNITNVVEKYEKRDDYINFMMNYLIKNVDLNNYKKTNNYLNIIIGLISCCDDFKKEFYINKLSKISKFTKEILTKKITKKKIKITYPHNKYNQIEISRELQNDLKIISYIIVNENVKLDSILYWFIPRFKETQKILNEIVDVKLAKKILSIGLISNLSTTIDHKINNIIFNQLNEYCDVHRNDLNRYPEYLVKLKNIYKNKLYSQHKNHITEVFTDVSENDKFILNIEIKKFK